MQDAVKNREQISALVDGQLRGEEFARTVEWIGHDDEARLTWDAYHLVGDVLRSGESVNRVGDTDFLARLRLSLNQEMPVKLNAVAPDLAMDVVADARVVKTPTLTPEAANESVFRWKMVAGLASLAAVSVIAWQGLNTWGGGARCCRIGACVAAAGQAGSSCVANGGR